jgi:hypothetical protein
MVLSLLMKQRQLTNFRENTFVWLMLLYFSIIGLILLFGRFLFREEVLQIIEFFFSPDGQLEYNGVVFIERLATPFLIMHAGLGMIGWIFLFSKPLLAGLGFVHVEKSEHKRFNLFITSTLLAIYLFGLYNISELLIGIRMPIYQEDSLFETLTAVGFFISGVLFFLIIYYVRKDTRTEKKLGITVFFLILALLSILISGEEISWGQRLFNLETPEYFANNNIQKETNFHNILTNLEKEHFTFSVGIIFSVLLFGSWLGIKESHRERLSMIIPPIEMFIPALLMLASSGYNEELFEEMATMFFLFYSIWIWSRWRLRIRNSKTAISNN